MLNKEINHNKEELGCVPEPLLKHYHKTSMVNSKIQHDMHFIKDDQTSIETIKGNDMHIREILGTYLDSIYNS